ncbi:type I restriction-modification system subunit M [Fusobacterium vincentii]|uniref:type I restriction-modification system subunit M n=1 Tax=Fusobacterium vincentii TaxID=155615 RepID=UPI000C1B86C1|nr:type I restriction-modification system subunit M [Fusobacterium vincentii]ATV06407.1 SAM-dependent methyltransferase [Fusobacterium vincentii]QYR56150.1 N-6 DNA methylase [Fusobacterium vincentii]
MTNNEIVQKLWNLCNVLRDDGITYHEYVTELTYILFLKMLAEQESEESVGIPEEYRWNNLVKLDGLELKNTYQKALIDLGQKGDNLAIIYRNAKTNIEEPANLKKIFSEIDKMDWYSVDKEDFGDLYEGLLEKNASEKKSGAGQYFTPRVLIDTIVKVTKPKLKERICDPASGTLGFIISANRYIKEKNDDYYGISEEDYDFQKKEAFSACELVPDTHRLGIMNALLHGVEGNFLQGDTLSATGTQLKNFDLILSNPPFGTKKGGERATRDDLVFSSSNKQLNFLQVIYRSLNLSGKARAGVILPDNVLFESGIGKDIRQDLLSKCNVHTILRLPTGIFYAPGVKTNVLFFDRAKTDIENTKNIWFYDLRTNMPNFGKTTPLTEKYFEEFVSTYDNDEEKEKLERWTKISIDEIIKKDYSLDLGLIKDESLLDIETLPNPILNANETIEKLEEAIDLLKSVVNELKNCGLSEED